MTTLYFGDEQDKRKAAIHEAAHLCVAISYGIRSRAWLIWSGTTDPTLEKLWVGKTGFLQPVPNQAAVSVAGYVGEIIALDGYDDNPNEIADLLELDRDSLSPSDLEGVPAEEGDRIAAIEDAARRLLLHREFWEWAIEQLVQNEVITDGQAWEQWLILASDT